MTFQKIPEPIQRRVLDLMRRGIVWTFAELRRPGKESLFCPFEQLRPEDCPQLIEYHVTRARKAVVRFLQNQSRHTVETAAEHIYRARLYHAKHQELTGSDVREAEMPFPLLTEAEVAELKA